MYIYLSSEEDGDDGDNYTDDNGDTDDDGCDDDVYDVDFITVSDYIYNLGDDYYCHHYHRSIYSYRHASWTCKASSHHQSKT